MTGEPDAGVLAAVMRLAVAVRDDGPDEVHAAAVEALAAAAGDPVAALTVAAALARVDEPVDRWWARPLPAKNTAPLSVVGPVGRYGETRRAAWRVAVPRPQQPGRAAAVCGTRGGLQRHKRVGEAPCGACVEAERGYQAARHVRRKARAAS